MDLQDVSLCRHGLYDAGFVGKEWEGKAQDGKH